MINHTLKGNQSEVLAENLEKLLPRVTEEGKRKIAESLLTKLKKCRPRPDRIWAQLNLSDEEEKLFNILCKLVWGKPTPSPKASTG